MRSLFWSEYFWPIPGGMEILGASLLRALCDRGHAVAVVTEQEAGLPAFEQYQGMPVYRFPCARTLADGDPREIGRLRTRMLRLRQAFQPDVLWLHSCGPLSFFHLSMQAAARAPALVTLHGLYADEVLEGDTVVRRMLREAEWLTTCSAALRAWLVQRVPEIGPRCSVLPNALQQPPIAPAPLPFDAPVLICLGRLVSLKGVDRAIAAVARLLPRYPRLRLLIAGDGEERVRLERQAAALGIAQSVDFLGWIAPDRVPHVLNRATLAVVPTRTFEAFSLVALQAAQMGRPVVAARCGGLPEVVLDGQTGVLVDPDDPAALARAIARLLDDPALARILGSDARRRAQREFRWEPLVTAYEQLLARCAAGTAAEAAPACVAP